MISSTTLAPEKAGPASAEPKRVFCFGDSLTAGTSPPSREDFPYGRYLEQALKNSQEQEGGAKTEIFVEWQGFPGWTASSLLEYADVGTRGLAQIFARAKKEQIENNRHEGYEDNMEDKGTNLGGKRQRQHEEVRPFDVVILLAGTNDLADEASSVDIFESIKGLHDLALKKGSTHTLALGIPTSAWQAENEAAKVLATSVNQKLESWAAQGSNPTVHYVPFPIKTFDSSSDLWSVDGLHFSEAGYKFLGASLAPIVAEFLAIG